MRRVGVVLAIALLVGCSGSTSVHPFGGTYHLLNIDGRPDPQPLYPGANTQVVRGTLNVGTDTLHLTIELQPTDSSGQPAGDITPLLAAIPYVRHGDSLLVVADTSGWGDGLIGGEVPGASQQIGTVLGSNVELSLFFGIPSSTGFTGPARRFLFTPAR